MKYAAAAIIFIILSVFTIVPARAGIDVDIRVPGIVIVPPSEDYDYPRYTYPRSEPRYTRDSCNRHWHQHGHGYGHRQMSHYHRHCHGWDGNHHNNHGGWGK